MKDERTFMAVGTVEVVGKQRERLPTRSCIATSAVIMVYYKTHCDIFILIYFFSILSDAKNVML